MEKKCRACFSESIISVHNFGKIPLADALSDSKKNQFQLYDLSTSFCPECSLFQINESIQPNLLFEENYPYYSSQIPEVAHHFSNYYNDVIQEYPIKEEDVILEIAGNDGVLLRHFQKHTKNVFSVEPSNLQADESKKLKINTINKFFSLNESEKIKILLPRLPKLIMANNVLAHVPNPDDFVKGLSNLMNEGTTAIIEVAHVLPMIQKGLFDMIFHQHYSYFSLLALDSLFKRNDLYINEVKEVSTQGGSLRLYISRNNFSKSSVKHLLKRELEAGLNDKEIYFKFSQKISALKEETHQLLEELKSENKKIVGYGAPGKSANYLNYFGIGTNFLECLVDISPSKQGKYFPNTGLKIYSVEYLEEIDFDYVFILAWNYADTILSTLNHLRGRGVQFITGLPELRVL